MNQDSLIELIKNKIKHNGKKGYIFHPSSTGEYSLECKLYIYCDLSTDYNVDIATRTNKYVNVIKKSLKDYWNQAFIYSSIAGAENFETKQLKIYFQGDNKPAEAKVVEIQLIPYNSLDGILPLRLGDKEIFIFCTEDAHPQLKIKRPFVYNYRFAYFIFNRTSGEIEESGGGSEGGKFAIAHEFGHIFGLADRYNYIQYYFASVHFLLDPFKSIPMWLSRSIDPIYLDDAKGNLMSIGEVSILGNFRVQKRPMLTPMQLDIILDSKKIERDKFASREVKGYEQFTFILGQELLNNGNENDIGNTKMKYIGIDYSISKSKPNIISNIPLRFELESKGQFTLNYSEDNKPNFGANISRTSTYTGNNNEIKNILENYLSNLVIKDEDNNDIPNDAESYFNFALANIKSNLRVPSVHGYFNPIVNPKIDTLQDPKELGKLLEKNPSRDPNMASIDSELARKAGKGNNYARNYIWNMHTYHNRSRMLMLYLILPIYIEPYKYP